MYVQSFWNKQQKKKQLEIDRKQRTNNYLKPKVAVKYFPWGVHVNVWLQLYCYAPD